MSKLVVYTTNGGGKTIETDATTWGDLKKQLVKVGINPEGMKAADNKKRSYENSEAELPADLTHMFLLPVKTKSGAGDVTYSFSEARKFIVDAIAEDEEGAKAHFNTGGKNYTNRSTADLNALIASYKPKGGKKASTKAEPVAKTATKSVAKAKPAVAEKPERVSRTVAKAKPVETKPAVPAKNVSDVVKDVALAKKGSVTPDTIVADLESLTGYNDAAIQRAIKAVLELKVISTDEIDNEELRKMAREIGSGFSDVRM